MEGASGGIRINGLPFNNAGGHVSGNVMLYYRKSGNADAINLTPYLSGNQVYFYQTRDGYADVWAEILYDLTGASTNFYMYDSIIRNCIINNFIPLVDSRGGQKEKNNGDYKTYRRR